MKGKGRGWDSLWRDGRGRGYCTEFEELEVVQWDPDWGR